MPFLNGNALDASQVATIVMLVSMLVFTGQYVFLGEWWQEPVGWSIVIERTGFVCLLALLVAQEYWPPGLAAQNDFLWAEAILLAVAAVGVNIGNLVMFRIQHASSPQQPSVAALAHAIRGLSPEDRKLLEKYLQTH